MNKVRWREHELLLVTVVSILGIAGYVWRIFDLSPESPDTLYGEPFISNGLSFSYSKNIMLPHVGSILLLYLCYLRMNLFILPRLFQTEAKEKGTFRLHFSLAGRIEMKGPGGESLKRVLQALLYTFLLFLFLGAGLGIAQYYQEQFAYFLPGNRDESRQIILGLGLKKAFVIVVVYVFYAALREASIHRLEKNDGRRAFRLLIANQVSGFLVVYVSIAYFFYSFYIARDYGFYAFYFGVLAPILLVIVCNLYWIFPLKGERSIFKRPVFGKLLSSTLICTAPFTLIVNPRFSPLIPMILFGWIFQLVITTPLSWLIYRLRRDKILQLRGLERALGKSEADLQFLRSQINPHFLFNALNTLYGTSLQEGAGRTAEGIQKLGDMMRFMLHENNQDRIPMDREIEYLKNYISLQKLRTQSSPSILIEDRIDGQSCQHMIAPMLLIPFVENAFKHGISLREKSWINIRLDCDEKYIHFEVRNSVHNRLKDDPEETKSGIGMKNVINRLKLVYGGRHEFYVHGDEKEFFVQLVIQP
ncbi:MAG TPA: histidine kinase [Puia sp.]|jgi:hypothetical protein|nr:histidine kinase [Puia sp.]